jgi:hypothetical protein
MLVIRCQHHRNIVRQWCWYEGKSLSKLERDSKKGYKIRLATSGVFAIFVSRRRGMITRNLNPKVQIFSILLVLALSSIVTISYSASAQAVSCSTQSLDKQILDTPTKVNNQGAIDFAQSSSQYTSEVVGFNASFLSISYLWGFDSSMCSVTPQGFGVTYLLQSQNGSRYTLTLGENADADQVYSTSIYPQDLANLYTARNQSATYSGYGVADNSAHSTQVDYALAYWFVPTASQPSGQTCGTLSAGTACEETEWDGLQNSTYDGYNQIHGNGEVIQTGTEGYVQNCSTSCSVGYDAWYGYLAGTSTGTIDNNTMTRANCGSRFTPSAGDEMTGVVGSQLEINGTSGDKYYTLLTDDTQSKVCESVVTFSHSGEKYGKEYFSDFFLEREQTGATSGFPLADFTALTFYDVTMGSSGTQFGAYPEYNSGYGISSYMYNSATDTAINVWTLNSGSTSYGYFNTTFVSSSGT